MPHKLFICILSFALSACATPTPRPPGPAPASTQPAAGRILLDFEKPELPVTWLPATGPVSPGTETSPAPLQRNSLKPQAGLWSLITNLTEATPGEIRYTPTNPIDLSTADLLTVQIAHDGAPSRNGDSSARLRITDTDGHSFDSDAFPVLSTWQAIPLDLRKAAMDVTLARTASIGLVLQPNTSKPPLNVKTDSWALQNNLQVFTGSSVGAPRTFFVESRGTSIHVGSVGQYQLVISSRGIAPSAEPWLQVFSAPAATAGTTAPRQVLGQPVTGLYLLDQDALLGSSPRNTNADDAPPRPGAPQPLSDSTTPPWSASGNWAWPASIQHAGAPMRWHVVWASPLGAIIEGEQEAGGFDRLGEPTLTAHWRLMVYQWGQVFVDVRWNQTGEPDPAKILPRPVSWALSTMSRPNEGPADANAERLLTEVYPPILREGFSTALPHRMQTGAAVAMIAPANLQKNNFWWTHEGGAGKPSRWVFGAGISSPPGLSPGTPASGEATCMLLVNSPNALAMAGAFGQYLAPPKIVAKQGELDRNFPGDLDNDGFVETYGFQVIRLAAGRVAFTIYPQERPLFYPPILFTVPADQREALDLKHSRLLINIDGKQFANPPQFPDGSFLLQIPYVLDRPVNVEAILVK